MILLVTAASNAQSCAGAVERATGERVQLASSLKQATSQLRSAEFSAVVADQALLDCNVASADLFWKMAGTAIPVFANFAISGEERVVREVKSALLRRDKEKLLAVRAAEAALRSELNGAVTGILLSSELALAQPELPPAVIKKLRSVYDLALQMKSRLEAVA